MLKVDILGHNLLWIDPRTIQSVCAQRNSNQEWMFRFYLISGADFFISAETHSPTVADERLQTLMDFIYPEEPEMSYRSKQNA